MWAWKICAIVSISLLGLGACTSKPEYIAWASGLVPVDTTIPPDTAIERWLAPYRQQLQARLGDTVVWLRATYCKTDSLGSLLVQALYAAVDSLLPDTPFLVIQNKGGIRMDCWEAGPLTRAELFQTMPFDNRVVIQCLPPAVAQRLLNHVQKHQWYYLQPDRHCEDSCCLVVLSDYLAQGGDYLDFLRPYAYQPVQNLLLRDAFEKGLHELQP